MLLSRIFHLLRGQATRDHATVDTTKSLSEELRSEQTQSRLMTLPAEIRNEIYRFTLLSDTSYLVTSNPFPEPALLRTCRAVRKEATSIFYLENAFEVDCPNWEHKIYQKFYERLVRDLSHFDPLPRVTTYWSNSGSHTNKTNLIEFLHALHDGTILLGLGYPGNRLSGIAGAFEIVRRMEKQKWKTVSQVLEVYLDEIAKKNDGWQWD